MELLEIITKNNDSFGEIRFTIIEGKPYAVGNDVAKALGYKNERSAINTHTKGAVLHSSLTTGGTQKLNFIPEGDIYRLIIKSELPKAQEFEKWIMEEVLPQIRETGGYIPMQQEDSEEDILAKALIIAQKTIEKKSLLLQQKERQLIEQQPKVEIAERMLTSQREYTLEQIAKLLATSPEDCPYGLGLEKISRVTLPRILREKGILSKAKKGRSYKNTPNKPYEKYFNVVDVNMAHFVNGHVQTKVKSEGLKFIYELLKKDSENYL